MASVLRSPLHKHILILRELTDECGSVSCCLCEAKDDVRGPTYCCEACGFFLHKSCGEDVHVPPRIQHPSHPDHLLELTSSKGSNEEDTEVNCAACTLPCHIFGLSYSCVDCRFNLDVRCAIITLPPSCVEDQKVEDQNEEILQHLAHNHPLTSFNVKLRNKIKCKLCLDYISGPTYGCRSCSFLIHKSCAEIELPSEMQHPFHPQHPLVFYFGEEQMTECKACGVIEPFGGKYRCDECQIAIHLPCAALTLPLQGWKQREDPAKIDHFSHRHPLMAFSFRCESRIRCRICNQNISPGEVYGCPDCCFMLHRSCAELTLPQEMVHPLHPEHALILHAEPPYDKPVQSYCRSCSCYYDGFIFHCMSCNFNICPNCALQTASAVEEGTSAEIQFYAHDHPLTLCLRGQHQNHCSVCEEEVKGIAYRCHQCQLVDIHKSCAQQPLILQHPFHPSHPLALFIRSSNGFPNCNACQRERFFVVMLRCSECNFYLDVNCSQKPSIRHEFHEHSLTYFARAGPNLQCNFCGIACNTDLYRCVQCDLNLHSDCLSLPVTIKTEHHYHPLTLCEKALGEYSESKEFYCDICEEERNPDLGVYTCEECGFIAHIYCVIPEEIAKTMKVAEAVDREREAEISRLKAEIEATETDLRKLKEDIEALKTQRESKAFF